MGEQGRAVVGRLVCDGGEGDVGMWAGEAGADEAADDAVDDEAVDGGEEVGDASEWVGVVCLEPAVAAAAGAVFAAACGALAAAEGGVYGVKEAAAAGRLDDGAGWGLAQPPAAKEAVRHKGQDRATKAASGAGKV